MKYFYIIFRLSIVLFLVLFITNCTTAQKVSMTPEFFNGYSEINAGDSTTLVWNIANASKVRIMNLKRNFNANDSIKVAPEETTIYDFYASAQNADTLKLKWRVFVNEEPREIKRGPEIIVKNTPSYNESEYVSGIIDLKNKPNLKNLKILRNIYSPTGKNNVLLRVLPLDEFGNYVTNMSAKNISINFWNITNNCDGISSVEPISDISEVNHNSDNVNYNLSILLDNSTYASDYFSVYDQILHFTASMNEKDNLSFTLFNHGKITDIPLLPSLLVNEKLNTEKPTQPNGFSAIYKHLVSSVKQLSDVNPKSEKAVILIAYSTDNASLLYDRNDVIELCKKHSIPVYIIGIGNGVDSYSFNYLCENTGGRFYLLNDDEIHKVRNILGEIAFSMKNYYLVEFPLSLNILNNCNKMKTKIEFNSSMGAVKDSIYINFKGEKEYFRYQAIASFNHREIEVDKSYNESLIELSQVLKDNPKARIELIGNSSIEGNEQICNDLAINRARNVRKALIALGTNPAQINVRNDGSNNPIYYFQESEKLQYFNRRVELRWLNPDLLPFEIIAGWAVSETEALKQVEEWENKGYRSYYERYLQSNIPAYRVKIWGYPTFEDAQKIANNLKKAYKQDFVVQ